MKNTFIGSFTEQFRNFNNTTYTSNNGVICDDSFVMFTCQNTAIFFSGVIYNKIELGFSAQTNNAEIAYAILNKKDVSALNVIDGSFTIIIRQPSKTTLVRDHHGTGSQIYYNDTFFASSLSLLLDTPQCKREINPAGLGSFLTIGYIPTGSSAFKDIIKLGAGCALVVDNGNKDTINLFQTDNITPQPKDSADDMNELAAQYGELHTQAIRRRIGNSTDVGILLSGGYDSGCNLAALRKQYSGEIRSFSIGFKGDNWSELPLAKCMSEEFGTIHHTYEIDGSEITALPSIVDELGDPFVEGGLMVNYAAMRMIGAQKPDIILGGDGSDQYFGTSGREVAMHYLAAKYGIKPFLHMIHSMLSRQRFECNNKSYRVRFHLSKILNILHGDMFGFEPFMLKKLIAGTEWQVDYRKSAKADVRSFEHLYTQHAYKSDLEKIINQVILFKASKMASMFGNEIAFPYMDAQLYDFLQTVPVGFKCKGETALSIAKGEVTAKFLLKHHYKLSLPKEITSKKKQGGFAPMPIFFKDKVQRARIAECVMESSLSREFLRRDEVEKFVTTYEHEANQEGNWFWYKQNKAIQYFNLLTLSVWWEKYIKSNDSITL